MKILVVGAGPAGLYFAYLMKRSRPGDDIRVIEQNPPDATFGFGVVLSGRALSFLAEGDAAVVERIKARTQTWSEQHIVHQGGRIVVDGSTYSAIERIALLNELQQICHDCGVDLRFGQRIDAMCGLEQFDVVVGADGANSLVRDTYAEAFGTRTNDLRNYFAWYGVEQPYLAHTLTFRAVSGGVFCGHHYRYTPSKSTFVAEVDAQTWHGSGLSAMDEAGRKRATERIFADTLGGKPLVSNQSAWRRWRLVKNDVWHHRNIVLIGDALRTAHPSIGSGTRLAMEDSIALWRAFCVEGDKVAAAYERFDRERRPIRDRLNKAAENSIAWYEAMAAKMAMPPLDFAYDYLLRTGVMTAERLAREAPEFMATYTARRSTAAP